jgi:hypothetical protein
VDSFLGTEIQATAVEPFSFAGIAVPGSCRYSGEECR